MIKTEFDYEHIIYNTYSGALGILDKELKEIYDNIEILKPSFNKDIQNKILALETNGFIVKDTIDEFARVCIDERMNRYNKDTLDLIIAPTMICNMKCPYCYEDQKPKIMSQEIKTKLIKFVENRIKENNFKNCSVTWYGGEPLLEIGIIRELSKQLINICNDNSINYTSTIVTNGVLLNRNTAQILTSECKIKCAQITIDGLKEVHNKRRILKNGNDSFDVLIDNIDSVKDLIKVLIRINIDKENADEIDKLVDYFIDNNNWGNKVEIYFYPIVSKGTDACNVDINNCLSAKDFGYMESKLLRKMYNKGAKNSIHVLYPKRTLAFCAALCTNSFVIDPEGLLYSCWDFIGIKEKSIGSLDDEIYLNKEHSKWLLLDIPNECKACNLVPLCKGGCPSARLANGNKPLCDPRNMSLREKLKITYDDFKANGVG